MRIRTTRVAVTTRTEVTAEGCTISRSPSVTAGREVEVDG